jgi:hypothetical protein
LPGDYGSVEYAQAARLVGVATFHLVASLARPVHEGDVRLALSRVKRDVRRFGLLPFSDRESPSLVSIVAGGPVSGSWWGHPAGGLIYQVGEGVDSDPDIVVVKLWRGKLTLIHRRLWPALIKIGRARSAWQTSGLSDVASELLDMVELEHSVRSDHLPEDFPMGSQGFRPALRNLEQRLLVLTRSVHTNTGAHALEAESWATWSARTRTPRISGTVASAQLIIEDAARRLEREVDSRQLLPWGRPRAKLASPARSL